MSIGMDRNTGRRLTDLEHLHQSITRILSTPVGTRVERRPFGSMLPELIDHPQNETLVLQLYGASATALVMHEPRFSLTRVQLVMATDAPHSSTLDIEGIAGEDASARPVSFNVKI